METISSILIIIFSLGMLTIFIMMVSIVTTGKTFPWQKDFFNPNIQRPKNIFLRFIDRILNG